jgi:hypothetical protein
VRSKEVLNSSKNRHVLAPIKTGGYLKHNSMKPVLQKGNSEG